MDWNIAFLLYIFTRLDAVLGVSIALSILLLTGTAVSAFVAFVDLDLEDKSKPLLLSFTAGLFFAFIALLVPSQKDMALIVGGAIGFEQASQLVESERIQNLSDNSLKALENWVEEQAAIGAE
jgi:hypothetical protein